MPKRYTLLLENKLFHTPFREWKSDKSFPIRLTARGLAQHGVLPSLAAGEWPNENQAVHNFLH
jgi:hypothetical protein